MHLTANKMQQAIFNFIFFEIRVESKDLRDGRKVDLLTNYESFILSHTNFRI